jgi:predicted GTPase
MADLLVVAKADAAPEPQVEAVLAEARALNPRAALLRAASALEADRAVGDVVGRRVLVLEDGPTLTHGGLPHGAGHAFARAAGALIVDPRPHAAPPLDRLWQDHPQLGPVLPAVGYAAAERAALAATIAAAAPDLVVVATPIDAARLLGLAIPCVRVLTSYRDLDAPGLAERVEARLERLPITAPRPG